LVGDFLGGVAFYV